MGRGRGPRPWRFWVPPLEAVRTCVVGIPAGVCFTAAALPTPFRLPPAAGWASSQGAVLVAAAALGLEDVGKGVDRRTGIGVRVEPAASLGADAAPLANQQRAAEQVEPDLHAAVTPFVQAGRIRTSPTGIPRAPEPARRASTTVGVAYQQASVAVSNVRVVRVADDVFAILTI